MESFCLVSFFPQMKSHVAYFFIWHAVLLIDCTADPAKKTFLLLSGSKFHIVCMLHFIWSNVKSGVTPFMNLGTPKKRNIQGN